MKRILIATVLLVTCGEAVVQAQDVTSNGSSYYPFSVPPTTGYLGYDGPAYCHSSTWQEGLLRGHADVIRSWGQYNYLTQLGAVYGQTACRMAIDNHGHAVDEYFSRRQQYREMRTADLSKRREKTTEYLQTAHRPRSSVSLLDGDGRVLFPAVLRGDSLVDYRARVERFLLTQGSTARLSLEERQLLAQLNDAVLRDLQSQVRQIPGQEYAAGKRFVTEVARQLQAMEG